MLDKNNTNVIPQTAEAYQYIFGPGERDSKRYFDTAFINPQDVKFFIPVRNRMTQTVVGTVKPHRRPRTQTRPIGPDAQKQVTAAPVAAQKQTLASSSADNAGNKQPQESSIRKQYFAGYMKSKPSYGNTYKTVDPLSAPISFIHFAEETQIDFRAEWLGWNRYFESLDKLLHESLMVRDSANSQQSIPTDTVSHPQIFDVENAAFHFLYLKHLICTCDLFDLPSSEIQAEDFDRLLQLGVIEGERDLQNPLLRKMVAYGTLRRIARETGKPFRDWDGSEKVLPSRGRWTAKPQEERIFHIRDRFKSTEKARKEKAEWTKVFLIQYDERTSFGDNYLRHLVRHHGFYGLHKLGVSDEEAVAMFKTEDKSHVQYEDFLEEINDSANKDVSIPSAQEHIFEANADATLPTIVVSVPQTAVDSTIPAHNPDDSASSTVNTEQAKPSPVLLSPNVASKSASKKKKNAAPHAPNSESGASAAPSVEPKKTKKAKGKASLSDTPLSLDIPVEQNAQSPSPSSQKRTREDDNEGDKTTDPAALPPPTKKRKMGSGSAVGESPLDTSRPLRRSSRTAHPAASEAPQPAANATKKVVKDKAPAKTTNNRKRAREEDGEGDNQENSLPPKKAKRQASVAPPAQEESKPVRRSTRATRGSSRQPTTAPVSNTVKPSRAKRAPKRANGGVKNVEPAVNSGAQELSNLEEKEVNKAEADVELPEKPKKSAGKKAPASSSSKPLRRSTRARKTPAI